MTRWYNQKGTGLRLEPWSPESLSIIPQLLSWRSGFQEGHSVKFTLWSHDLGCVWKRKRGKEGHRDASSSIFSLVCSLHVSEKRLSRRWASSSGQRSQSMVSQKIYRVFFFLFFQGECGTLCVILLWPLQVTQSRISWRPLSQIPV